MAFMLQVSSVPLFHGSDYLSILHPVPDVTVDGPAFHAGLRYGDKILQCNGYDFTMVTHKKAVDYIKKDPVLNLLVARKGITQL